MSEKRDRLEAAGGHREFKTRVDRTLRSTYFSRKVSPLWPFMVFEIVRYIIHNKKEGERFHRRATYWLAEEKDVLWGQHDVGDRDTFDLKAGTTIYEFTAREFRGQGFYSYD